MAAPRDALRKRQPIPAQAGLLERDLELAVIDELLDSTVDGGGGAVLISGQPGLGKTRLHDICLEHARSRDLLALRATGHELEQTVAFGVASQLLRSWLGAVPTDERERLLGEAPERVKALFAGGPTLHAAEAEDGLAVAHGLFVMLAAATETRPALLAIDDLQWCDSASLGFVLYLLHRLTELSLALLLTTRPLGMDGGELDSIAGHPAIRLRSLAPLGREAVGELVTSRLGGEDAAALADACMETTGGNPFYIHELLLALDEDLETAGDQLHEHARSMAPDTVTRSLRVRVGRLGPEAGALARGVAILGDDVPLRTAAALAELELAVASKGADALAAADVLLAREPLRFVHPLIRTAIEQDIPASQRASAHLQAARLLASEGAGVEQIAAHLLRGRAEGDRWAVEQLRAAAAEARAQGATASSRRYLERALEEPPPRELRADVLADLGIVEAEIGLADADEHLALAARASEDPRRQGELALARGRALYARDLAEQSADVFKDALTQLAAAPATEEERELRDRLQIGWLISATKVPSLQAEAMRLSAAAMSRVQSGALSAADRLLLVQATTEAAFGARPSKEVAGLAARAWDDGRLLEQETVSSFAWVAIAAAFCLAGELERSIETAEAAAASARAHSAPLAFATASYMRVLPQLWQGNIDGGLADLELARDARRYGWRQYVRSAAAHCCLCLIEKGELDRADAVLVEDAPLAEPYDGEDAIRLFALAELRRAQQRQNEAYELALLAGEAAGTGLPYLGYCPWRASAAQSALVLGQRQRAGELIEEEFERLETSQVLHERIRALRLAGLCQGGEGGLARLREAVELGEANPLRLETIHALLAFGSALRRHGKRTASRPPLERAFDLAGRGGATVLQELARTELVAAGARPRRQSLFSGPESLTPSEHRIAELAAGGQSNRQIAGALFVTPKTVEYHLRNCYRKLDIQTRGELGRALQA